MNFKKTLLSTALATALGVSVSADAGTITGSWTGAFTMLGGNGSVTANTDLSSCLPGMTVGGVCERTGVSGTMSFDTNTGAGSGTVVPFSFFGSGLASATTITFQAIGNGFGGPGTLVLGNMGFNWNTNNGIPVSIVLDAQGFFGAMAGGLAVSNTVTGTGGAIPASNNTVVGGSTYPIGPAVMATTTWNTTNIGTPVLGTNPSGTLPLVNDTVVDSTNGDIGIGGSPMPAGPFTGFNANFDILSMHIDTCTPDVCPPPPSVPVPAAVWLFGSGLVGLVGVARRKRSA